MPITIPRKVVPITEAKPAPAAPAEQGLTRAEVGAMLDAERAAFAQQLESVTRAFSGALSAIQAQPQSKPAAGWDFHVEYRQNGAIETIRATPRKLKD
jgi:hypothetical protein